MKEGNLMQYERGKILKVTQKIISKIENMEDNSTKRAILAKLRNSINKSINENFDVLPFLFENLPEEFLSRNNEPSPEEQSILATLQLYALHKQGKNKNKIILDDKKEYRDFGSSLRELRNGDNFNPIDRRFNSMLTADIFNEWIIHLRHLVKLLRASDKDIKVDYPKLSEDLYWIAIGFKNNIRVQWSRSYYKMNFKGDEENEKQK